MIKKNKIFITFCFTLLTFTIASVELKEIKWNMSNNLNNSIYSKKNVEINYINNIPSFYSIKSSKHEISEDTDLYISFDNPDKIDETGNYSVIYKNF